jgi:co-chaperonin GroES (HSP10)
MTKAEPVSSGQSLNLHPLNDCVLVELKQSTDKFSVKEGRFDSRSEGIVIETENKSHIKRTITEDQYAYLKGKRIHFEQFNAIDPIKRGGKQYGFIKISDIRGYED